ncbi:hypothetical protein [Nocardioides alcanivorans]|uniref:hypothetical protein n=1 Tax=Nocardioides alcanivorans TaxID=2897352 RepID=UPI001F396C85|nr:hypothetical protein [Nocardioides alcanivorans]
MGTQFRDSMIERVTYRGPARIGGKSFHEYELAIDFEFIAEMAGEDMSKIPDYTFRVHLSDDHTIRRAVIDFDGKQSRFDYTRWGKPVDIQAPPAHLVDGMDAA